ncbi:MAG TPA: DNA mismatch repair endonuclease MutL [Candidatus Ornithospirochaeta avicola]|uniref:DNA mismatch repair protein MutL n=1 Tax=Candidatus Ornithospirochaeta avicola TaxID=2840896 RepID=A0A9D1PUP0_9SPIO|nr:DNA mismatch repair endonuclease MutL [Candidatus Ornithospirochaeta avicola]
MGKINILDSLVASRIAAGEVVERPESILREFLDNALDSGAENITCSIEGGGIDEVSVQDDGEGIKKADLSLIANDHATSKIKTGDDLYNITTLGFRGEALYSISAVSRLTISSFDSDEEKANEIVIDNLSRSEIMPSALEKGTRVKSEDLFAYLPARRAFLKRPQTESSLCQKTFISKALPFFDRSFWFYSDGALKVRFEKCQSLKERMMMLYRPMGIADADVLHLRTKSDDFTIDIIAGNSGVKRSDRKEIRIYVNNRQVDEYSLLQAVIYGYGELLPGGTFPVAAVFINDKAELVDFNIHPAKKEVKIRNIGDIHHAIVLLIQNGIERKIPKISLKEEQSPLLFDNDSYIRTGSENKDRSHFFEHRENYRSFMPHQKSTKMEEKAARTTERPEDPSWIEQARELKKIKDEKKENEEENKEIEFEYIGQAFNLFLIFTSGDELYFLDQHAAHERILYEEIKAKKNIQKLLIPLALDLEKDAESFLEKNIEIYSSIGIKIEKKDGKFFITELPSSMRCTEDRIVSYIESTVADEKKIEADIFAIVACKAAIKQGDEIDRYTAESLIEKTLLLDSPSCPHGRTFLAKISDDELKRLVGRTK